MSLRLVLLDMSERVWANSSASREAAPTGRTRTPNSPRNWNCHFAKLAEGPYPRLPAAAEFRSAANLMPSTHRDDSNSPSGPRQVIENGSAGIGHAEWLICDRLESR
jgi:hypothetical protein